MSPAWSPLPSPGQPGSLLGVRPGREARAHFACLSAFPCLVAPAFWHRGRLPHADGDGERGRGSWRGAGRAGWGAGEVTELRQDCGAAGSAPLQGTALGQRHHNLPCGPALRTSPGVCRSFKQIGSQASKCAQMFPK